MTFKNILQSTLKMVKADITYVAEPKGEDVWLTYPQAIANGGDCEELAFAMSDVLILKGVPAESIKLVSGTLNRRDKERHMVLQVTETASGETFILDSLRRSVIPADKYFPRYMIKPIMKLSPIGALALAKRNK